MQGAACTPTSCTRHLPARIRQNAIRPNTPSTLPTTWAHIPYGRFLHPHRTLSACLHAICLRGISIRRAGTRHPPALPTTWGDIPDS
mmetsp:Transcript_32427/g.81252  ORF Transcript_32427/g.81252 Transcript_32427/m.81252 type:complete len:87 (+) Transcript_32427:265-525(+)